MMGLWQSSHTTARKIVAARPVANMIPSRTQEFQMPEETSTFAAAERTPAAPPPLRDKASLAAALRLMLGSNHTECQIFMRLVTQGCLTKEQICAIVVRAHQPIKIGSVNALIRLLRKKLTDQGIKIPPLHEFGCELRKGSPRKNPRAARQTSPECCRQPPRQGCRKPAGAFF